MEKIKLRAYDGTAIAGLLMLPVLFYTAPGIMAEKNGSAAWIAVLGAHVPVTCLFLVTAALMRRYKGRDIIEVTRAVMGKPVGILYGLALSLYFCYYTGVFTREGAEIIKVYGLRLTPVYFTAGVIVLAAAVMNFLGGKAIVKSAGLFFILILLGIVLIMIMGANRYNPDHLFPIMGNGTPDILKSGAQMASMLSGAILLALFAPSFEDTGVMRKSGVIALAISAAASVLMYLCVVMMFSAPLASGMASVFMEMGKSIYYNHFFYRFESMLLFFIIFSSVIMASLGLYIAAKSMSAAIKSGRTRISVIACAAIALVIAFIPANLPDLTNRYIAIIKNCGILFIAGVPLLLFIISSVKRVFKYEKN